MPGLEMRHVRASYDEPYHRGSIHQLVDRVDGRLHRLVGRVLPDKGEHGEELQVFMLQLTELRHVS